MTSRSITCVVADDHPAVLEAVCSVLIEAGIEVVARAQDGERALAEIEARTPAVAVVDLRMPRISGTEIARRSLSAAPSTAVILYTAYGERAQLMEAIDVGARGFLLKESPLTDLTHAVETVAAGDVYIDGALAGSLVTAEVAGSLPSLTRREREILRLVADGCSNEQIGSRLFISPETVRTHVRKAMKKLDADTRTQAVAVALRQSLIA